MMVNRSAKWWNTRRSVILMRDKDKRRLLAEADAERQRSRDRDYASGRIAFDRVHPLIDEYEE